MFSLFVRREVKCALALQEKIDVYVVDRDEERFLSAMADVASGTALRQLPFATIGSVTTAVCWELGFRVVAEAESSSLVGLRAALGQWWQRNRR